MFLSCGRYQRNQLPGNTREFQTPSLPAPGAGRGVYRGRLRRWRRRIEKRGGTDRWPSHIFILYWPLLTPRHGWNPLSSCAPSAENSAFFFRRDRCKCSPLLPPPPPYADTRQPSMPDDFQLRFNSLLLVFQEFPPFECIDFSSW